jgi:hypothetical protein
MITLVIGKVYTDRHIGRLSYIGRIGYELNIPGVKGSNVFVDLSTGVQVRLTKKEIEQLQP